MVWAEAPWPGAHGHGVRRTVSSVGPGKMAPWHHGRRIGWAANSQLDSSRFLGLPVVHACAAREKQRCKVLAVRGHFGIRGCDWHGMGRRSRSGGGGDTTTRSSCSCSCSW